MPPAARRRRIVDATTGTFFGFVSTGALTSLTVTALQPVGGFLWPTVDDLMLGQRAVPEPATAALLMLGLGAIGLSARRRRNATTATSVTFGEVTA